MSELRTRTIEQKVIIPATPEDVYWALMDPKVHAQFTGDEAEGSAEVGGEFIAYGGYITAKNLKLVEGRRILQDWTTTEWPEGYPPSRLEVILVERKGGTELTMRHSNVPESQADDYAEGWREHYWTKLQEYFRAQAKRGRKKG